MLISGVGLGFDNHGSLAGEAGAGPSSAGEAWSAGGVVERGNVGVGTICAGDTSSTTLDIHHPERPWSPLVAERAAPQATGLDQMVDHAARQAGPGPEPVGLVDVCRGDLFLAALNPDPDGPFVTISLRGGALNWLTQAGVSYVLEAALQAFAAECTEDRPEVVRRAVDHVTRWQIRALAELLASLFDPDLLAVLPGCFVPAFGNARLPSFWGSRLVAEAAQHQQLPDDSTEVKPQVGLLCLLTEQPRGQVFC